MLVARAPRATVARASVHWEEELAVWGGRRPRERCNPHGSLLSLLWWRARGGAAAAGAAGSPTRVWAELAARIGRLYGRGSYGPEWKVVALRPSPPGSPPAQALP